MTRSRYPRSVAKYIRREKARIRRQTQNKEEAQKQITQLLDRLEGSKTSS